MSGSPLTLSDAGVFAERFGAITANVERALHGNGQAVHLALVTLVAEGHLLIEDVPGVGKTTLAKALAASLGCEWRRVQFTPDLLPSDVTGVTVFQREQGRFEFQPGPIFAHVVLGDEINRASPKTQAALLEAMEERQVTVGSATHVLPRPFMVIATQNPVERQGTYPLPDGQLDRFLLRVSLGYPGRDAEMTMLDTHGGEQQMEVLPAVAEVRDVLAMIRVARAVHVSRSLKSYLLDLAEATRRHSALSLGMSPRATLALLRAGRGHAASCGRNYVLPDDVKRVAAPVLAHRLVVTSAARADGASGRDIVETVLRSVPVPVGTD